MKIKIIFICVAIAVLAVSFSFINSIGFNKDNKEISFNKLSEKDKIYIKNSLIAKLKKDSIFILYNEVSNAQIEILAGVPFSSNRAKKKFNRPSSQSITTLTKYYKEWGVQRPEELAKIDVLKFLLLASLKDRYTEFKTMDTQTIVQVFNSSKRPLKKIDIARRRSIVKSRLFQTTK